MYWQFAGCRFELSTSFGLMAMQAMHTTVQWFAPLRHNGRHSVLTLTDILYISRLLYVECAAGSQFCCHCFVHI